MKHRPTLLGALRMPGPTRYYDADGRYLPGADSPALMARKDRLLQRIDGVYEELNALQDAHNATDYGCLQSGSCCKVGLVLHTAELENMARHLQQRFEEDPASRPRVLKSLERSLHDPSWNFGEGIGDMMCAFYDNGCTVYPFRPAVCRMYGVILELNDDCPRRRLSSGRAFVWVRKEADQTVRRLYDAVDAYGRLFPRADTSRYMASGLLMFLLPRPEVERIRARTPAKFWRASHGYRTQFVPSGRKKPYAEADGKVPRFPLKLVAR